jgi:hypothetical protein
MASFSTLVNSSYCLALMLPFQRLLVAKPSIDSHQSTRTSSTLTLPLAIAYSSRGFKFSHIFVDQATHYNWTFGLKSMQHNNIQAAFLAFWDEARSLARQFRCNCNKMLFGSAVHSFLHLNQSLIAASLAGRQSSNGLLESHWKIMVHTSCPDLTKKQTPRMFCYYAIKHSA